jgi:spermidine synthase
VFLPRLVDSLNADDYVRDESRIRSLVTLYALELTGSFLGLLLIVVLTPAKMRYILTVHLLGLIVLTCFWAGARWRLFLAVLAPLPVLYLVFFSVLDRASISYFYKAKAGLRRVQFLASEFSPYQRVDIFDGWREDRPSTYLYLNGNLFYGSTRLNQHNLFVAILPNLLVPHPSNALVIGGGSLDNARYLAPRVQRLRIVELDPTVVRLSRQHIQERRNGFPTNWDLIIDDGKHYLGVYQGPPFDVISVDVPIPTFLQTAMLHSDRFFALARSRLVPGGVFSISLSGEYSPGRRSGHPGALAHRVMAGLLKNFRHVKVIGADRHHYAWASDAPLAFTANDVTSRMMDFLSTSRAGDRFGTPEISFLNDDEVRSRAQGFAPIGEADMQIVLRLSINKLRDRFYAAGE